MFNYLVTLLIYSVGSPHTAGKAVIGTGFTHCRINTLSKSLLGGSSWGVIQKVKTSAVIHCIYWLTVHSRQIYANERKTLVSSATSAALQGFSSTSRTRFLSTGEMLSLSVTMSTSSTRSTGYGPPLPYLKYICDAQSEKIDFNFLCKVTLADYCMNLLV